MPTLWPLSYRGTRSSSLTFNTSYLYRVHSRYNLVPVSFIAQSGTRNNKLVCAYVFCAHKLRFGTKIETYQFEKCSCPLMTEVRYWRTYCNILQRSTTVHFLNSCTMRHQGRRSISSIWGGRGKPVAKYEKDTLSVSNIGEGGGDTRVQSLSNND